MQALIAIIQDFYVGLYGNEDVDRTDPAEFAPPEGLFLVGYLDGAPVACGGWRRLSATTAEVKRMWVHDEQRGRGLARQVLAGLEAAAADDGIETMTLNTGYLQTDAIGFYEAHGYVRTDERYGHYAGFEGAFFFTKPLL